MANKNDDQKNINQKPQTQEQHGNLSEDRKQSPCSVVYDDINENLHIQSRAPTPSRTEGSGQQDNDE